MIYRPIFLVAGMLVLACNGQTAEFLPKSGTANTIEIRSNESESDTLLRATCLAGGQVDLRLGATFQLGKGKLESIRISLATGNRTASLTGISVQSPDTEMTGGTELLTAVPRDHRAFSILIQNRPISIKVSGGNTNKFQLSERATNGLKSFLEKCRAGQN